MYYNDLIFLVITMSFSMLSLINVLYYLNDIKSKISNIDILIIILLNIPISILNINKVYFFSEFGFVLVTLIFLRIKEHIRLKRLFIEYLIILIIDLIFELLVFSFIHSSLFITSNDLYIIIIKVILTYLSFFIVFTLDKKRLVKRIDSSMIDTSNFMSFLLLSVFIIIGVANYYTFNSQFIHTILFIFLLIIFLLISIIKYYQNLNRINTIKINNMLKKQEESNIYINSFKMFKHNLKYKLIGLKNLTDSENNDIIDELINSNELELKKVDIIRNIPASLVNIIIDPIVKEIDFINLKITNHLKNEDLFYRNNKEYLLICEMVGNAVTNAIESSTDDSRLLFNFYQENNNQVIEIINDFNNDIDVSMLGSLNYSTKKRNSGYGLNYLLTSTIVTEVSIINNLFIVKIKIPY